MVRFLRSRLQPRTGSSNLLLTFWPCLCCSPSSWKATSVQPTHQTRVWVRALVLGYDTMNSAMHLLSQWLLNVTAVQNEASSWSVPCWECDWLPERTEREISALPVGGHSIHSLSLCLSISISVSQSLTHSPSDCLSPSNMNVFSVSYKVTMPVWETSLSVSEILKLCVFISQCCLNKPTKVPLCIGNIFWSIKIK